MFFLFSNPPCILEIGAGSMTCQESHYANESPVNMRHAFKDCHFLLKGVIVFARLYLT